MCILPPEVQGLFGGFAPSRGQGVRICKIMAAEWNTQARFYKNALHAHDQTQGGQPHTRKKKWRELCDLTAFTVESLWRPAPSQLKANRRHRGQELGNFVRMGDGLQLPTVVHQTLNLGPTFAVEPRLSPPELLSLVRQVAKHCPDTESERCVSAGVDVLRKAHPKASGLPLRRVEQFFKEENLCFLPADKEGEFMVFSAGSFGKKALDAVNGAFTRIIE
ncbi:hypothetical protein HPB48_005688 [Haemaphysalis longicornis]|uniref:Uncharacterized protein n=1 Tax=Haemaphysalis longicornis TaxID=44386 RepID=A0A9J6GVP1_HAELO|nr:hypothetical protein HPB48_005688 [Haemaphysalis longicornis]